MLDFYSWLNNLFRIGVKNKTQNKHKQNRKAKTIKLEENIGENLLDVWITTLMFIV